MNPRVHEHPSTQAHFGFRCAIESDSDVDSEDLEWSTSPSGRDGPDGNSHHTPEGKSGESSATDSELTSSDYYYTEIQYTEFTS